MRQILLFEAGGQRFAADSHVVDRVVRVVDLTPLPGAPRVIRGSFSLNGTTVPVGDLRRRLGLPEREIELGDRIIVVRAGSRLLGVLTEGETWIAPFRPEDVVPVTHVIREDEVVAGVGRLPDGLVLIQNLARFLAIENELSFAEPANAAK